MMTFISRRARFITAFFWIMALAGCAGSSTRGADEGGRIPSNNSSNDGVMVPPPFQDNLVKDAATLLSQLSSADFNEDRCIPYLEALEKNIHGVEPYKLPAGYIERNAQELIELVWKSQLTLHQRIAQMGEPCVNQARDTFRLFRFIIDYIAERKVRAPNHDPSGKGYFANSPRPFLDKSPYFLTLTADVDKSIEFVPGDLLLARGVSYLSAIIARVGDVESQFSHIVFVDKNESGKPQTIESYVGVGVRFYDMDTALKNENPRLLQLRSKDAKLARDAASFMHEQVQGRINRKEKPIPYDYSFDFKDHSALSCAEVARYAYEVASKKQVIIPKYPTNLSLDREFLNHFALRQEKTFEPADMEVDPRFEIVSEFRDLRITRDSRLKDVVLSELIRWVREENYHFVSTKKAWMARNIAWPIRRTPLWPLFKKLTGTDDFSKDIPKGQLATFAMLGQLGDVLLEHLRIADAAFEKKTGWPMTYLNLRDELERFRKADLAVLSNPKTKKKSQFHWVFQPK